ncbi:MAG: hypothetical protein WD894_22685 [Pirellulales bacterium]
MLHFHATLHARAPEVSPGTAIELRDVLTPTLIVPPAALASPFAMTFEEAVAALEQLVRMFVEPDGSFVWVSSNAATEVLAPRWQLDGNLFDRNGRLLFVDLKGSCTESDLDQLLAAFGWPTTPLIFELTREAVFLDETEFRHYAAR